MAINELTNVRIYGRATWWFPNIVTKWKVADDDVAGNEPFCAETPGENLHVEKMKEFQHLQTNEGDSFNT